MTCILAFDPGLANLGYALVSEKDNILSVREMDTIKTSSGEALEERLFSLGNAIDNLVLKYEPDVICTESVFLNMNQKSVMNVAMVIGLVGYFAASHSLPFFPYSPLQIKQSVTGQGRATKEQVQQVLFHIFPTMRRTNVLHASDAVAVAYCHIRMTKFKKFIV